MTRPETPSWLAPWLAASPRTIREMAVSTRREADALNAVADALEAELRRRGWSNAAATDSASTFSRGSGG